MSTCVLVKIYLQNVWHAASLTLYATISPRLSRSLCVPNLIHQACWLFCQRKRTSNIIYSRDCLVFQAPLFSWNTAASPKGIHILNSDKWLAHNSEVCIRVADTEEFIQNLVGLIQCDCNNQIWILPGFILILTSVNILYAQF